MPSLLTTTAHKAADFEASSFVSAKSRRRRRAQDEDSSEDDDTDKDEEEEISVGDGYSSFVVLEDSTPAEEVQKINTQFEKSRAFLVAGLRGIASGGASKPSIAAGWELLADRLDWDVKPEAPG